MARPKKPTKDEFASDWMKQIKSGIEFRKKYSTRESWDKYRRYYRGQWSPGIVPVNKFFSYGRMLMPRVYFRAPRVTITASQPEMVFHAKVVEALDNLLIKELLLKHTLKMSVLHGFLSGVGPIKLGYDSQFGYLPDQSVSPSGETLTQVSTKNVGERIEYSQMVRPGYPWALHCRPEDVIVPWGSTDQFSLPWVAHYILRPLDDVKQDQKYKNVENLQGTRTPRMSDGDRKSEAFRPRSERDKGITYAELFEVTDVKSRKRYVFCEENLLLADDDVLQTEAGLPWEFLNFNMDPEYFWSIPDAHIICPQQEELNETVTQSNHHRRISMLKFLYKAGAVKKDELEKFLSGDVGVAVQIEDVENIQAAIIQMQPHMPPELQREAAYHIQSMREELGFSQNQEGAFSPYHGKTASESMIVAQSFEERNDERKDIMCDTLANIIRKWNSMIFRFWNEEKVVHLVSPEGEPYWVAYTGDQLKSDYLLSVDADSGMPVTRSLKYQMSSELFKTLAGDPMTDQVLLRQIFLEQFSPVDPRVPMLLQTQYGGAPEALAAARQPHPAHAGGRSQGNQGGGRKPMTPQSPISFDEAKKKFMTQ